MSIFRFVLNLMSSSELSIAYLIIVISVVFNNTFTFLLFLSTIMKSLLLFYPKKIFKESYLGRRPKGALNCNIFNCGGNPKSGAIVSGHMTDIVMILSFLLLEVPSKKMLMLSSFILVTTGVSRYLTKCHSLFQIVLGSLVGFGLGFSLFKLQGLIKNKRFIKDKEKVMNVLNKI